MVEDLHRGRRVVDRRGQGPDGDVDHDAKRECWVLFDRAFDPERDHGPELLLRVGTRVTVPVELDQDRALGDEVAGDLGDDQQAVVGAGEAHEASGVDRLNCACDPALGRRASPTPYDAGGTPRLARALADRHQRPVRVRELVHAINEVSPDSTLLMAEAVIRSVGAHEEMLARLIVALERRCGVARTMRWPGARGWTLSSTSWEKREVCRDLVRCYGPTRPNDHPSGYTVMLTGEVMIHTAVKTKTRQPMESITTRSRGDASLVLMPAKKSDEANRTTPST